MTPWRTGKEQIVIADAGRTKACRTAVLGVALACIVSMTACSREAEEPGEPAVVAQAQASGRTRARPAGPDHVWIEAEKPTAENFETNRGGWGNAHYLSEDNWLHFAIAANEAIQGVQVLRDRVVNRIGQLRAEIKALDQKLGAAGGSKA